MMESTGIRTPAIRKDFKAIFIIFICKDLCLEYNTKAIQAFVPELLQYTFFC